MSTTASTLPASLDFPPGRAVVTVREIAAKLGYSPDHVARLVEDGTLQALDGARRTGSRPSWRITVEAYRAFIQSRLPAGAELESPPHCAATQRNPSPPATDPPSVKKTRP